MEVITLDVNSNLHLVIAHGVPKGSLLGPLLFFVYINVLPMNIQDAKLVIYVDDQNILANDDKEEFQANLYAPI
jgi:hypothetical protein